MKTKKRLKKKLGLLSDVSVMFAQRMLNDLKNRRLDWLMRPSKNKLRKIKRGYKKPLERVIRFKTENSKG